MTHDDYLWDPQRGQADHETAELERLLGRFRHGGEPLRDLAPIGRGPSPIWWVAAAAAIAVAVTLIFTMGGDVKKNASLELVAGKTVLTADEWFTASTDANELRLGKHSLDDIGQFRLTPGSRLQIKRVDDQETRFYLERGTLHAFVASDVQPRFFQVETPSGICVDLGCEYDLTVDDSGEAHVTVTLGQIAFESEFGELYVPRGAECRTDRNGNGLPHFSDSDPKIRDIAEKYLAASDPRDVRQIAEVLCDVVREKRDSLTLWHLLQVPQPEVYEIVERKLLDLVGHPDADPNDPVAIKGAPELDPSVWRKHLETYWW